MDTRSMPRLLLVVAGIILGIVVALGVPWLLRYEKESGCDARVVGSDSPDGRFRAQLTDKACHGGFGYAAHFASLRVEKLGSDGWFLNMELDTDQPSSDPPTMEWDGADVLHIKIVSLQYTGSVDRDLNDMHVVRTYVRSVSH
jgi:hypothetical protein